ncbi:hypothetical protein BGW38_006500 [Lunasporangiospora selenospora]|uniref:Uncharacterized protein n=1 Tax=Lunasporangiospora selenospora TaxID=979761 RepID=A0A9P6FM44_9FUNG|nr:hypothetical protein BGW38_006500 [Lunasporangiospora selenospora]
MAQGQGVFVAPSEPPLPIASSVISIPFISDYVHLSSRATPYSTWAPSTSVQRRYSEYQDGQTYGPNEMCLNRYSEMDKACAVLGIVAAILWLIDFGFIIGICGSRIRSNDCDQRCADGNSSRDRSPWMGETVEVNAITGAGLNHLGMAGAGGRRRSIRRGQIGPDSSYDPENDDYPAGIGFNSNGHRQNLRGSNTYCPNRGCRHSGMREIESYSYEGDEDGCFQQEDYYDTLDQRKGKGLVASLSNWKKRHSSATMASTPVSRASDKDKDQEQQQQQQQHNSTQWRLFGGAIGKTSSRRRGSEPVQSILTNLSQKNTGTNDERPDDLRGDYGPGGMNDYPPGMVMPSIQKPTATLISTPLCDTPLMRDCVESTMLPMRFPDNSIQSNNSKDSNSIAMSESTISQQPQLMHQTSFGSVEAAPTVLSPPPRPRNRWQQQLAEGGAGDGTSGGSSGPGTAVSSTKTF